MYFLSFLKSVIRKPGNVDLCLSLIIIHCIVLYCVIDCRLREQYIHLI